MKIGTDIAYIPRFDKLSEHTIERIFTPYEVKVSEEKKAKRGEYLASRFASKEAYVKAKGTGFKGISPSDIETRSDDNGAPYLVIKGVRESGTMLSLSHDGDYALAFVVIENE